MPELVQIITTLLWLSTIVSFFLFAGLAILDLSEGRDPARQGVGLRSRAADRQPASGD